MENKYSAPEPLAPVITLGDWVLTILLLALPMVNIVMLCIWAFGGGTHPSKSNFAKATLIWIMAGIIMGFFGLLFAVGLGSGMLLGGSLLFL